MRVAKKDWIFVAVIVVVLGALLVGKGKLKAGNVPSDDKHSQFYEALNKGVVRIEIEKRCVDCHGIRSIPLPKDHPPKEQCLICHMFSQVKK